MIKILLNTIALEPNRWTTEKIAYYKLNQLLEPIARNGFQNLEVWQYHISREDERTVKTYRQQADAFGLAFPIIGMYPKLHLQSDASKREMDKFNKMFNYAKILDAEIVKIWLGAIGSAEITTDAEIRSLDFLAEALELAQQYDITITAENHDNTLLDTIESCHKVLQKLDAPKLKICYQPYDFSNKTQLISDYLSLKTSVIHVHFQGRKNGEFALLENADLDYKVFVAALAEHGFKGYWSIEFVKDCVVAQPQDFDLELVLANARRDRDFLVDAAKEMGLL